MCLKTVIVDGKTFHQGVAYTATFTWEGQTYMLSKDALTPWTIEGVDVYGGLSSNFVLFLAPYLFQPKHKFVGLMERHRESQQEIERHKRRLVDEATWRESSRPSEDSAEVQQALEKLKEITGGKFKHWTHITLVRREENQDV
ncbi:hypothetical protein D3C81_987390 [compost metagenome]